MKILNLVRRYFLSVPIYLSDFPVIVHG